MPRAGLNTTEVVVAGAELADEAGYAAVSLAVLAARLGVKARALYKHVDGIGDLQHRIATLTLTAAGDALRDALQGKAREDAISVDGFLLASLESYPQGRPQRWPNHARTAFGPHRPFFRVPSLGTTGRRPPVGR